MRSLPRLTGVDVAGTNNVVVRVGAPQSVVVHADRNLLGRVTTQVRSGSLVTMDTPGTLNPRTPMFVAVSVPSLEALTVQGSGNISVTGINDPSLTVRLPGSGSVALTATHSLDASISGSGTILFTGNPTQVSKSVTGSGTISGE